MLIPCPVCVAAVALLLMAKQLMKQLLADPAYPPNKPVQMPNGTIYIPLHVAIMAGNTAAEKLLLEAGAAPTTSSVYTLGNTDSRVCNSRRSMCWCRSGGRHQQQR
jgi:ankyrin repeat protein